MITMHAAVLFADPVASESREHLAMASFANRQKILAAAQQVDALEPWPLTSAGHKCMGQSSRIFSVESRKACQAHADGNGHEFFQYREQRTGQGAKCATVATCDNPTPSPAWDVYHNDMLWPEFQQHAKCTNKKKAKAVATCRDECQAAAASRGHTYYQFNAPRLLCRTARTCDNPVEAGKGFRIYWAPQNPWTEPPQQPQPSTGPVVQPSTGPVVGTDERCKQLMASPSAPPHMVTEMPSICEQAVTSLTIADFREGTYIIDAPGIYRLEEDIVMEPRGNTIDARMCPTKDSSKYSMEKGYWLGFFAAIVIDSKDVFIDLNDKTISQSPLFLRCQRFFQIIQLGNKPFQAAAGPPQFKALDDALRPASNVIIAGGTIGSNSHIGIHGVNVNNFWLHDTVVRDFEVGGVQINGCRNCFVTDTTVGPSSSHVPALATLSQANLLLRVISTSQPDWLTTYSEFTNLRDAVQEFVMGGCNETCDVFRPPLEDDDSTLADGSAMYGILFHKSSLPIHDFLSCNDEENLCDAETFGPVEVSNVKIQDLQLRTDEIIQMKVNGKVVIGPAGDVFQFQRLRQGENRENYVGNVLSQAQLKMGWLRIMFEEEKLKTKDEIFEMFGSTYFPPAVQSWATGASSYSEMEEILSPTYHCNQDSMNHHNKGVMGIRISMTDDVTLRDVTVEGLRNVGEGSPQAGQLCESGDGYKGNDVRGITATKAYIKAKNVQVENLHSKNGNIYCFEQRFGVVVTGSVDVDKCQKMLEEDEGTCDKYSDCSACVDNGCSMTASGVCSKSTEVTESCWQTDGGVWDLKETCDNFNEFTANKKLCAAGSDCTACVDIPMVDGFSNCKWFEGVGDSNGYCSPERFCKSGSHPVDDVTSCPLSVLSGGSGGGSGL